MSVCVQGSDRPADRETSSAEEIAQRLSESCVVHSCLPRTAYSLPTETWKREYSVLSVIIVRGYCMHCYDSGLKACW